MIPHLVFRVLIGRRLEGFSLRESNESKRKELKLMAFRGFPTKHFPPDHPTGKPKSEKFPPMHAKLPNKDFKVSLLNMNKQLRVISYLRNTYNTKDRH